MIPQLEAADAIISKAFAMKGHQLSLDKWYQAGIIKARLGKWKEAADFFEEVVEGNHSSQVWQLVVAGHVNLEIKNWKKAAKYFERALTHFVSEETVESIELVPKDHHKRERARETSWLDLEGLHFTYEADEKILQDNPKSEAQNRGNFSSDKELEYDRSRFERVIKAEIQTIDHTPAEVYAEAALAMLKTDQKKLSEKYCQKALERFGDKVPPQLYSTLGQLKKKDGKYKEADDFFTKALDLCKEDPLLDVIYYGGKVKEELHNHKSAMNLYKLAGKKLNETNVDYIKKSLKSHCEGDFWFSSD